jgi:hypothetical protein
MTQDRTKICRQTGCGQSVTNADYCPAHTRDNQETRYDKARSTDAIRKMYYTARYRRFRDFLWRRNPMCARISKGVRCNNPSTDLHHLVSPEMPGGLALFLTDSNVIFLCKNCHPGGTAGTPHWKPNVDYVPSFAGFGVLGQSNPNPY